MAVTLCMVVKDEAENLPACLASVLPFVDDALIADTGSSDGSAELIRGITGKAAVPLSLDPANCHSLTPARNALYAQVKTDWILYFDADERLADGAGTALRTALAENATATDGYFGQWETFIDGEPGFEDYKLFVFRSHLRKRGFAHANVQLDIRMKGGDEQWLHGLRVNHHPSAAIMPGKRELYWRRLVQSMSLEAGWLRHNWFAGYMCFQDGRFEEAHRLFAPLIESRSMLFPVEGLNARMVAVDMLVREGRLAEAAARIAEGLSFAAEAGTDFEVKVNRRIVPWFAAAQAHLCEGRPDAVRAYRFSA